MTERSDISGGYPFLCGVLLAKLTEPQLGELMADIERWAVEERERPNGHPGMLDHAAQIATDEVARRADDRARMAEALQQVRDSRR